MHRPLGAIERYIWSGEQRRPLNGAIVADVEGSLDGRSLEKALLAVQRRHPLLQVAVAAAAPLESLVPPAIEAELSRHSPLPAALRPARQCCGMPFSLNRSCNSTTSWPQHDR